MKKHSGKIFLPEGEFPLCCSPARRSPAGELTYWFISILLTVSDLELHSSVTFCVIGVCHYLCHVIYEAMSQWRACHRPQITKKKKGVNAKTQRQCWQKQHSPDYSHWLLLSVSTSSVACWSCFSKINTYRKWCDVCDVCWWQTEEGRKSLLFTSVGLTTCTSSVLRP